MSCSSTLSLRLFASILGAASLAAVALAPTTAHAGIAACGNIDVKAEASCQVLTSGGCTAQCTPVNYKLTCSGKFEAECDGECNANIDATCNASCTTDCTAKCTAQPGSFECGADCEGRCNVDCDGQCSAAGNKAECDAACKASCHGHCSAECSATKPELDCTAKCNASCSGTCTAKANAQCQVDCQVKKDLPACEQSLSGGCTAQCQKPEGALFCDGNYVDTGDNLKNCIDALNAYVHAHIQYSGSASCSGNECNAQGQVSSSCSAASAHKVDPASGGAAFAVAAIAGMGIARRRRRS